MGLLLVSLEREPNDREFGIVKKVYNPSAKRLEDLLDEAIHRRLIAKAERAITGQGSSLLERVLPPFLLAKSRNSLQVFRSIVGASVLETQPSDQNFAHLADISTVTAALVLREIDPGTDVFGKPPRMITQQAVRALAIEFLKSRIPELEATSLPSGASKDPIWLDLLNSATGSRIPLSAFQKRLNLSLTRTTDARWRSLSKARFEHMAANVPLQGRAHTEDDVVATVAELSAAVSTGWVAIFDIFQAFQKRHRVSLVDFKKLIVKLQMADRLELAPLNVPLMFSEEARAKSALTVGALTFHLARIPK